MGGSYLPLSRRAGAGDSESGGAGKGGENESCWEMIGFAGGLNVECEKYVRSFWHEHLELCNLLREGPPV